MNEIGKESSISIPSGLRTHLAQKQPFEILGYGSKILEDTCRKFYANLWSNNFSLGDWLYPLTE